MAEMCLRRTRAEQVAQVIDRLALIAPTPSDMVKRQDDVLQAIKPLGLEWRARNLIALAEVLVEQHAGEVPDSAAGLMGLPGVGHYVANAVLCFAFGRRAVILDTNTERIVSRVYGRGEGRRWQLRLDLHRMAGAQGPDAQFNYALLDLGALVCRPRKPLCGECPLQRHCAMYRGTSPEAGSTSSGEEMLTTTGSAA